jgi:hypothetical protein
MAASLDLPGGWLKGRVRGTVRQALTRDLVGGVLLRLRAAGGA